MTCINPQKYETGALYLIKRNYWPRSKREKIMALLLMGLSLQFVLDFMVAGVSLMFGLGLFAFIASILCSAAFFQNAKEVPWLISGLSSSRVSVAVSILLVLLLYTSIFVVVAEICCESCWFYTLWTCFDSEICFDGCWNLNLVNSVDFNQSQHWGMVLHLIEHWILLWCVTKSTLTCVLSLGIFQMCLVKFYLTPKPVFLFVLSIIIMLFCPFNKHNMHWCENW